MLEPIPKLIKKDFRYTLASVSCVEEFVKLGYVLHTGKEQNSRLISWKFNKYVSKIMTFELQSGHKIVHSLTNRHDLGIVARRGSQKQAHWLYILFRCISKFSTHPSLQL